MLLLFGIIIFNRIKTIKKDKLDYESYSYLDAFGYTEFNIFNNDKGKHF